MKVGTERFVYLSCALIASAVALSSLRLFGGRNLVFADENEMAGEISTESSFLPTWKLLDNTQKRQFLAGYIKGWQDAGKVTNIAISYIRSNPKKALDGLESIRSIYDMSDVKPELLARALDAFYSEPENTAVGLSAAITAVKNTLR